MIGLGRDIAMFKPVISAAVQGDPDAILVVEFAEEDQAENLARLKQLNELMADLGFGWNNPPRKWGGVVEITEPALQSAVADFRAAGLNVMMSMKEQGKPVSFVEDCAVPLQHLADYTERLNAVFARHGTSGTMYAHASEGCLHVRPVLNLRLEKDVKAMRAIAEETFAMVREYKGSHSGEHGDGIVRSEFHEAMFGPRIIADFKEVKQRFDPESCAQSQQDRRRAQDGRPDAVSLPAGLSRRRFQDRARLVGLSRRRRRLPGAVEMCNNNGACRKLEGGVMCPSYRATRNEKDVTRGRANTLRLAISGQLGPDALASDEMAETLKLCVSCKACRHECPTGRRHGQDEDRGAGRARRQARASAARSAGGLPARLCRSRLPRRAAGQFAQSQPVCCENCSSGAPASAPGARCPRSGAMCFAPTAKPSARPTAARSCCSPTPSTASMSGKISTPRSACWSTAATGCTSRGRPAGVGRCCCGRTYLSAGLVDNARAELDRLVATYAPFAARGVPIIGLEPSCLLTLRDELLSLRSDETAKAISAHALLFEEFLVREAQAGRLKLPLGSIARKVLLHGHCHQKSFGAFKPVEQLLRLIPDLTVEIVESSCCGMAGAFGYGAETYQASIEMAELSLLPAIRRADPATIVVADGTSCRHQIKDGTERPALHAARVLAMSLDRAKSVSTPAPSKESIHG